MWRIFSAVLDALLPPHEDVALARSLSEEDIAGLLNPQEAGQGWICALFPYRDKRVRALVRAVKYYGEMRALAPFGKALGEYVLEILAEKQLLGGWERPLVLPIPSSRERQRARGYNQAERLAKTAHPYMGVPVELRTHVLARHERESQVHVERSKRKDNIRSAFYVTDPPAVAGRFIILIDDVVESGSTLADAKRALMDAGAKEVIGIALAH